MIYMEIEVRKVLIVQPEMSKCFAEMATCQSDCSLGDSSGAV